jgi:benzil reductase ((S)-benzoin forming)
MRLAIITGGSQGLGLALCQQISSQGIDVIEFSRSAPHPFSIRTDLANPARSHADIACALAALPRAQLQELWVIGNAATLTPIGQIATQSPQHILANLNTNFNSTILFFAAVIAHFQESRCRKVLVNISSGAAQKGYAGWSLYCASKAGLAHFIHALALEQQQHQQPFIPININPGVMDTAMQTQICASAASDFPDVHRFVARRAQGELAQPARVAQAVLRILALPLAAGQTYDVSDYWV